jgi:thymidylate synthase (FAD)
VWKIDLHNLLHFIQLRIDSHAQWEIQQYARVLAKIVEQVVPITWRAFKDYRLGALYLSSDEQRAVREHNTECITSKSEKHEFESKKQILHI